MTAAGTVPAAGGSEGLLKPAGSAAGSSVHLDVLTPSVSVAAGSSPHLGALTPTRSVASAMGGSVAGSAIGQIPVAAESVLGEAVVDTGVSGGLRAAVGARRWGWFRWLGGRADRAGELKALRAAVGSVARSREYRFTEEDFRSMVAVRRS